MARVGHLDHSAVITLPGLATWWTVGQPKGESTPSRGGPQCRPEPRLRCRAADCPCPTLSLCPGQLLGLHLQKWPQAPPQPPSLLGAVGLHCQLPLPSAHRMPCKVTKTRGCQAEAVWGHRSSQFPAQLYQPMLTSQAREWVLCDFKNGVTMVTDLRLLRRLSELLQIKPCERFCVGIICWVLGLYQFRLFNFIK